MSATHAEEIGGLLMAAGMTEEAAELSRRLGDALTSPSPRTEGRLAGYVRQSEEALAARSAGAEIMRRWVAAQTAEIPAPPAIPERPEFYPVAMPPRPDRYSVVGTVQGRFHDDRFRLDLATGQVEAAEFRSVDTDVSVAESPDGYRPGGTYRADVYQAVSAWTACDELPEEIAAACVDAPALMTGYAASVEARELAEDEAVAAEAAHRAAVTAWGLAETSARVARREWLARWGVVGLLRWGHPRYCDTPFVLEGQLVALGAYQEYPSPVTQSPEEWEL